MALTSQRHLPPEITRLAIDYLQPFNFMDICSYLNTLSSCSLVCRDFRVAAQKKIFEEIEFLSDELDHLQPRLKDFEYLLRSSSHILQYIRKLALGHLALGAPSCAETITTFLSPNSLPRLTSLRLTGDLAEELDEASQWTAFPQFIQDQIISLLPQLGSIEVVRLANLPPTFLPSCKEARFITLSSSDFASSPPDVINSDSDPSNEDQEVEHHPLLWLRITACSMESPTNKAVQAFLETSKCQLERLDIMDLEDPIECSTMVDLILCQRDTLEHLSLRHFIFMPLEARSEMRESLKLSFFPKLYVLCVNICFEDTVASIQLPGANRSSALHWLVDIFESVSEPHPLLGLEMRIDYTMGPLITFDVVDLVKPCIPLLRRLDKVFTGPMFSELEYIRIPPPTPMPNEAEEEANYEKVVKIVADKMVEVFSEELAESFEAGLLMFEDKTEDDHWTEYIEEKIY
ncbi:hypothetical protein DL96DRAFT_1550385 [Flagelloscypha sp. PMI_526]|nr:hypothetical protein DL96DRAFT_1550385 [Flagelloscypha sp. PMI_526]